jgi:putative ABC transport system permease protein
MEARLLRAALLRRRGMVLLAVLAVAIGASVASAMLHVSGDVSLKLTRELRSLGPNLLVVPAGSGEDAAGRYLGERAMRARLAAAGIDGVPVLYVVARVNGRPAPLVGADLDAARRLHPSWRISRGGPGVLVGARLAKRLGLNPGDVLTLEPAGAPPGRTPLRRTVGATLEAGGPDDEALWLPLADAQAIARLPGHVSLIQARVTGDRAAAARRTLEAGGDAEALLLHALSATEAGLLERMRRLMLLVTLAALVGAGLCAFGTLTDLALERRREIALMKALGATASSIVRQLAAESLAIGLAGGLLGWLIGLGLADLIGRQVFHSAVRLRWDVPPIVLVLALVVAALSGLGPIRLALRVEPALALKGD